MIERNSFVFLLVFTAALLVISCGKNSDKSKVVATIGKDQITENYITASLKAKRRPSDFTNSSKDKNIKMLDQLIENLIFALRIV